MSDKNILVSGGANGIGAAVVLLFARAGYNVAINYHNSKDDAYILAKKCIDLGVKAVPIQADVTSEADVDNMARRVSEEIGKLDVLVNNAGLAQESAFQKMTKKDMLVSLSNSLVSNMIMTRVFVPKVMKQKSAVVNIATIYALDQSGSTGLPVYSAAKAGLINFTQTMAKIHAPSIRFNVVVPGFTLTPHWDAIDEKVKKACLDSTLQKEWVLPEDIAESVMFLANASKINAQTVVVDGGWSKR